MPTLDAAHAETLSAGLATAEQPRAAAEPGTWLGRYRVVERIASGGMGDVFRAEHARLQQQAAVKVARGGQRSLARALIEEAAVLNGLDHPSIVRLLDAGTCDDGTPYLVLEHVSGRTLADCLDNPRRFSVSRALRILRQLAAALDYMHAHGIVHRDIKPANIMLDEIADDTVKVLDFGIAIRESQSEPGPASLAGTPRYMAPEQVSGGACSRAVDLYALAALAVELLTGAPPFQSDSVPGLLHEVLHEAPRLPSSLGLSVEGLDAVFARALARDPGERFASAADFVRAVARVFVRQGRRKPVQGSCAAQA